MTWEDFQTLCNNIGLTQTGPDDYGRYFFSYGDQQIFHQVKPRQNGNLGRSGWLNGSRGQNIFVIEHNDHTYTFPLTAGGQIWIEDLLSEDAVENEREQHPKLDLILQEIFNI